MLPASVWKDVKDPDARPLYTEHYDHNKDSEEMMNVAADNPQLVKRLTAQFNHGWQGSMD